MDQTATSEEGRKVSEESWTDTTKRLVKQFLKEPYLHVVHIRTPMGFNAASKKVVTYKSLKEFDDRPQNYIDNMMFLTVYVRMTKFKGPIFGMEQRLPGQIEEDALVFKKPEFCYRWYKDREGVVIRKGLNTLSSTQLERHAKSLLKEAQLFHFSYIGKEQLEQEKDDEVLHDQIF